VQLYQTIFSKKLEPNQNTFVNMFLAIGYSKRTEYANELLQEMERLHMKPNSDVYVSMIEAFARARAIKRAIQVFGIMEQHNVRWTCRTCCALIVFLSEYDVPIEHQSACRTLTRGLRGKMEIGIEELTDDERSQFKTMLRLLLQKYKL